MVLTIKYICLKLNQIFNSDVPEYLESGVTEPTWVKLKRDLCSPAKEKDPDNKAKGENNVLPIVESKVSIFLI